MDLNKLELPKLRCFYCYDLVTFKIIEYYSSGVLALICPLCNGIHNAPQPIRMD